MPGFSVLCCSSVLQTSLKGFPLEQSHLDATTMRGNSTKVLSVISWDDNTYSIAPLDQSDVVPVFKFSHVSIPLEAVEHHLWGEPSCEINC